MIGDKIYSGKYSSVYEASNDRTKVIKAELVGIRNPKEFFHEVISQNESSKSGYVLGIHEFEIGKFESTFNERDTGYCWFYITLMPKLDYSITK